MNHTVIIGVRADHPTHTPEAEAVVVTLNGQRVLLELDDGSTLDLDAAELRAAMGERSTSLRAAA